MRLSFYSATCAAVAQRSAIEIDLSLSVMTVLRRLAAALNTFWCYRLCQVHVIWALKILC